MTALRDDLLRLARAYDGDDTWSAEEFDGYFRAVDAVLDKAGPDACLEEALRAGASESGSLLCVALDVLGVLTDRQPALLPVLLSVTGQALTSSDEDVRWSVANALNHGDDARVLPQLLQLADDDDPDIRWKVVCALPTLVDEAQATLDHPAVQALLAAFEDDDPDVRDWAVFGLGVQLDVDGPVVRDALARRLEDDGGNTASEAAVALARRGDPRALPVVAAQLASPDVGNLYVEAAGELGTPLLLPLLEHLRANGWREDHEPRPTTLDHAIRSCTPTDEQGDAKTHEPAGPRPR